MDDEPRPRLALERLFARVERWDGPKGNRVFELEGQDFLDERGVDDNLRLHVDLVVVNDEDVAAFQLGAAEDDVFETSLGRIVPEAPTAGVPGGLARFESCEGIARGGLGGGLLDPGLVEVDTVIE